MQKIQTRGLGDNIHAFITDKLGDGPVLFTNEGQRAFVASEQEIDPTESFKKSWQQMRRGELLSLSEMWESIDAV